MDRAASALDKLQRGHGAAHRQAWSGVQPHPCGGHRERARSVHCAAAARRDIYNVADDEPAPPEDVIAYAAELLGMEPPPEVPFEDADLSPMARSFYGDSRRISNALIKSELGVRLAYPNYRDGLKALKETK